jgi:Alpha/beta hydrolase domain
VSGSHMASFEEIPGKAPDLMGAFDLSALGYTETEYLVAGTATSYQLDGERGTDGRWAVTAGAEAEYRSRILVRRPLDAARFSGTVVVEWNNVSAGIDGSPDWILLHRHLAAQGHIWVGVTAQRAGVDGGGIVEGLHLKVLDPDRYGVLLHPGDAWSFDIFTQAGRLLRLPAGESPLGDLVPDRILALGESQSAACLVTYINAVEPLAQVFDGFFVHGRPGRGVSIDGVFQPTRDLEAVTEAISSGGESIRADVRVPVMVLQSETDVILLGGGRADQPDTDRIRVWEIAGAAHADSYIASAGRHDDGKIGAEQLAVLLRPTTNLLIGKTDSPINSGPQQHYVGQAALAQFVRWASDGTAPPPAPRLEQDPGRPGFLVDEAGIARGGIRTPWVDVPAAVLSGLGQSGETFALLFGRTEPFDEQALAERYPGGRPEYLERFEVALDATVSAGFLLDDDRSEILGVAAASYPVIVSD